MWLNLQVIIIFYAINSKYYNLNELLDFERWVELKEHHIKSEILEFVLALGSGRCRSWVHVTHLEISCHGVIRRNVLTYGHRQWVSRKKDDHLASLLQWEMVQFFQNVVCKALWEHQEKGIRRKWEERNGKKRQSFKNKSHTKTLIATLRNWNSLFEKLQTVQSLLLWFIIKMAHNGFRGLGNLMGNF